MILLTGATGYIGSHVWVELLQSGERVIGVDNFSNSNPNVLDRLKKITGKEILFQEGNICDPDFVSYLFNGYDIQSTIHFASFKSVEESFRNPIKYYQNNLNSLLTLISEMSKSDKHKKIVFSSSATIYDKCNEIPYMENMQLGCSNPYGWTKYMCEQILRDLRSSDSKWEIACLRYFNPIGAHESGLIGEDPVGVPSNLMPYITQVAIGNRGVLKVYGNDWPTPDGTGVRDYIHVVDLAKAHVKAVKYLTKEKNFLTVNLGAGKGYSVLELIKTFEKVSGKNIQYQFSGRRHGDLAAYYADVSYAKKILNWQAEYTLEDMCRDAWRWQLYNPMGYATK